MNPEEIQQKLEENREMYLRNIEVTRNNWELSDAKKAQELRAAYADAKRTHDALVGQYRQALQERVEGLQKEVFGVRRFGGSDLATSLMLRRDASSRLADVTDAEQLQEVLGEADLLGDEPLAQAVLLRAYRLHSDLSDMGPVVRAYFSKRPEGLQAWEQLQRASENHNGLETLGPSFATGVPEPEKPEELDRSLEMNYPPN